MYFCSKYIGKKKTYALKCELEKLNPDVIVCEIDESMKPKTDIESIIAGADFVVNTLDEPYIGYTSSKISRICVKHDIPHYIAGGFDAHLASTGELIIPYVTPCVECYAKHFKTVLKDWKPSKHPVQTRYTEIGGLSCMSLFSASYACIEIIKHIAGLVEMNSDYKIRGEFLFTDMSLTYLNVEKNPDCPVCGGKRNE
jgi:molybdopterin/thiamine biosynthesis adenylyltransferase